MAFGTKVRGIAAAFVMAIAAASGSSCDDDSPDRAAPARETVTAPAVTGPLCELLPAGDDPGATATLTDDPADVALQWIPA